MNRGGPPPPDQQPQPDDAPSTANANVGDNGTFLRLYQVWKGRNRFCCGGRLILGPDFRSLFLTTSLILVPVVLFCVFVGRELLHEIPHHGAIYVIVCAVVCTIYIMILLLITSATDPGIIPRNASPPEPDDDDSNISTDWVGSHGGGYFLPPTKEVNVNGVIVKVKYCQTCMLYRPPRCSHCSVCNNCVDRFDHHCPWVGQCIGKRNYRYFFMFVSSTTVLCLYIFSLCCVNIHQITETHNHNLKEAIIKTPVSGLLILYTFIASWFVGGLTVFHLYLISTNQTTYENFRYRYGPKGNPHNLGCIGNYKEIFWSKIPQSRNYFRAKVKSDVCSNSNGSLSSGSESISDMSKNSSDVEMGRRQAVDAQEFDDLRTQFQAVGRLDA